MGEFMDKAIDPVCGMTVSPDSAAGEYEYGGNTYYFCSKGCVEKFKNNPDSFLTPGPETVDLPQDVEYTCPMHPEIVRIGPGSCPICGMALEPKHVSLDDKPDAELAYMTRRFWICVLLTIPVFGLATAEMVCEPACAALGFQEKEPEPEVGPTVAVVAPLTVKVIWSPSGSVALRL